MRDRNAPPANKNRPIKPANAIFVVEILQLYSSAFCLQDFEDEKTRSIEEAVARARKEWQDQRLSDIDDQIAAARKEWLRKHNDELEKRLSNAIEEVRRIWEEEQTQKAKEVIVITFIKFFLFKE